MDEAIRLGRLLDELLPDEAEVRGLLAMMLLQHARTPARTANDGRLVTLPEQDRRRWDRSAVDEGRQLLVSALSRGTPGPYQVQAAMAAVHADAPDHDGTDWGQLAALYGVLASMRPSPVVELNRAVAVAMADGATAGLRVLDEVGDELDGYHLLHSTRAELLLRAGDRDGARTAFERALLLTDNDRERAHIVGRLATATDDRAE